MANQSENLQANSSTDGNLAAPVTKSEDPPRMIHDPRTAFHPDLHVYYQARYEEIKDLVPADTHTKAAESSLTTEQDFPAFNALPIAQSQGSASVAKEQAGLTCPSVIKPTFSQPSPGYRIKFDEHALIPSLAPYTGQSLAIQNLNTYWAATYNVDARFERAREVQRQTAYQDSLEAMRPYFKERQFIDRQEERN